MTQLEGDVAVSLRSTHIAGHGVPIASVVCRESLGGSFSTMFRSAFPSVCCFSITTTGPAFELCRGCLFSNVSARYNTVPHAFD